MLVKSCDIRGPKVELIWRNLEPEEADTQAEVFVRERVDVIVAFEDKSIERRAGGDRRHAGSDPDRLPPSRPIRSATASSRACRSPDGT